MKISEAINELQKIMDDIGDIEVLCWPHDGQDKDYSLTNMVIVERDGKYSVVVDSE